MKQSRIPLTIDSIISNVKDERPKPNCIRCGDCCEAFYMENEFVDQFRSYFQRIVSKEVHSKELEWTKVQTVDNKCVFLFPDNTCSIYKYRPKTCRDFGNMDFLECPKIGPDGKERTEKEFERIKERNTNSSLWSDEYKNSILNEAKERIKLLKTREGKK